MERLAAVLTGDLIGSTLAGQAATDTAIALIRSVALEEQGLGGSDVRFSRYRGDGWQVYCSDPHRVFRIASLILANLHSRPDLPSTRISAACGTVASLPAIGLDSASGDAFTMSGRGLDTIKRRKLVYSQADGKDAWKAAFFSQLEWQAFRWSPEQAQAIALSFRLDPPHPGKSAEELGISRQAFSARLDGAGYVPLWEAEAVFRRARIDSP
jgi:hypothetical protein